MVETVQPQLQFVFWWSIPVVRVVQILRCRRGEDARAPTVAVPPQVLCGSDCRKLQLQFIVGRRFSCRGAEADSHGFAVQQTMVSTVAVLGQGDRCPWYAGRAGFSCRSHARCVQRQVPGYVSLMQFINKVVHTPVVAQSLIPMAWQTTEMPQLLVDTVVDVLVVSVKRVPQLPL